MDFSNIIGQHHIKNHLQKSADGDRVAHAQLFNGPNGSGTLPMAIAYAHYLLCKNNPNAKVMCDKLAHPDMHFVFPTNTTDKVKKHALSDQFLEEWRLFVNENPYQSLYEWLQHIGIDKKQGNINVDEAKEILKKMSLKSFEGNYKIMIIWMADKLNTEASNKLLKLIEEPTEKTVFILVTEKKEQLLTTITSRCQLIEFPPIGETDITEALINTYQIEATRAKLIGHKAQGDFSKALQLLTPSESEGQFEQWFITWIRAAFRAKGNKTVIKDLLEWSESIAASGREVQKNFLQYCLEFFRQALLSNYQAKDLVYFEPQTGNFDLNKFAPFVHGANILQIYEALNDAIYHIERNANAKIILTDLSIKLTRYLHTKAA